MSNMEATNLKQKNIKDSINIQDMDEKILLPVKYLKPTVDYSSKGWLDFVQFYNYWIIVPDDKLAIIKDIILDLNIFTAIDDIQDYTTLRKGIPTAYKIFGVANVVIAFDYVLCGTLGKVLDLNHPKAMSIYVDGLRGTLAGQGKEIYWRENFLCPTEEEYDQMATTKTSSWCLLLARLMQLFDSTHRNVEACATIMGLYFQIWDDYNGLTNPRYFRSKGFCDDIREGKFSFPIVHAINTHLEVKQIIIDILRQRTKDISLKKQVLLVLQKCGSFEYTRNRLEKLKLIFLKEVNKLGGNPFLGDVLEFASKTN